MTRFESFSTKYSRIIDTSLTLDTSRLKRPVDVRLKNHKMRNFARFFSVVKTPGGGGVGSHMEGTGMLVGHFEFSPQKRPIWAWTELMQNSTRDSWKLSNKNQVKLFRDYSS